MKLNVLNGVLFPRVNRSDYTKNKTKRKEEDGYECQICHATTGLVVHHIMPRRDGGMDDIKNLITLCQSCHGHIEHGINPALGFHGVSHAYERECVFCKERFVTKDDREKYCSILCKARDEEQPKKWRVFKHATPTVKVKDPEHAKSSVMICKGCYVQFNPTRKWQKFCSTDCKRAYLKRKQKGAMADLIESYKSDPPKPSVIGRAGWIA